MNRSTTELFYQPVVAAMNNTDEMGGPDGEEYTSLMDAIAAEAMKRKAAYLSARVDVAAMIAGMLDGKEWSVETLDEIADVLRTAGYQIRDVDDDSEGDDANREMGLPDGDDWGNK